MKIIANRDHCASGKIFNIGNPRNHFSVRELANMMLELARHYPEYAESAARVQLVETSSGQYYGAGYQDVQDRIPKIDNAREHLGWEPQVGMADALKHIFDAYRTQVKHARTLIDQ
jgi:nucleoside-diphosphate-sugar epimerase